MPPKQNLSRMGSRRMDSNNNLQILNFKLPSTATLGSIPSQYQQNNRYAVCDTDSQSSDSGSVGLLDDSPLPTLHSPSNNGATMRTKYNASPLHSRGALTMSMSPLNNLNKTPPPGIFIEQKSSAVFSAPKSKTINSTSPTTSPHKDQSSPSLYFLQRQNLSPTHHHQSQYVKKGLELASEVYQIAPKRSSSKTRLITRRTGASMQSSTMTTK